MPSLKSLRCLNLAPNGSERACDDAACAALAQRTSACSVCVLARDCRPRRYARPTTHVTHDGVFVEMSAVDFRCKRTKISSKSVDKLRTVGRGGALASRTAWLKAVGGRRSRTTTTTVYKRDRWLQ